MEAIKSERPFHSHLSFNVMCRFLGDYSLGRDVPYSPGPEKRLWLFVWRLPWWVMCLLLPHRGGKPAVLVGAGEEDTQLGALLVMCESLLLAPTVVLGFKASVNPSQGSRTPMAKFSTAVDPLGCGHLHRAGHDGGAVFWELLCRSSATRLAPWPSGQATAEIHTRHERFAVYRQ